jgi:phosphate-selective porin
VPRALRARCALFAALWVCVAAPAWSQPIEAGDADLDLGWDEGPRYGLVLRERWFGSQISLAGRIGGTLFLDAGHLDGDLPGEGWQAEIRRARLYAGGRLSGILDTEYRVELALEGSRVLLNDFYLRWEPSRIADTVTVGVMDPPFGLQTLVASRSRSLMEAAAPSAAFSPGYRLGVEAAGTHDAPDLSWYLNVSTVGQRQETGDASETPIRGTARLVWRPDPDPSRLLHLGLGVSTTGGGDVRFRSRPESFLAPYLVDTGDVDGAATVIGLEAAWSRGPFSAQIEGYYAVLDPEETGARLGLDGVYVQGAWIVTGERREYDRIRSIFRRVDPTVPFHPTRGGRGAVEIAARISWLDLSDGPLLGGRMLTATVGATWTWNAWVRIQAGYVFADVRDRPDASFAHIVQARLELGI